MNHSLFVRIEFFYCQLQEGVYDHPFDLAVALEALANRAWDDVDYLCNNIVED
ncbi:hypothetical protein [Halotia branconii]|uniref:Uncharacterized protein n=1 Tax=Halotia branconii CENA392 TaxID=1539056 RepID=A0AAJ6NN18_9CYAN|nr:hypothetical protein [Halotia branconii]WGV23364.1 hypothetical protein QI031_16180 [Halotia branconii CENA392]